MDASTKKAFDKWMSDRVRRKMEEEMGSGIPETSVQFLARLEKASYRFYSQRDDIRKAFRKWRLPLIHIGMRNGPDGEPVHYAVKPGDGALEESYPDKKADPTDDRNRLPGSILGLNEHIAPVVENEPIRYKENRKSKHFKEASNETTNSDDYDIEKFQIFQQLGVLRWYAAEDFEKRKNEPRLFQGPWLSTGFAVVIDITNGAAGGVFIVCDMHPRHEHTGERMPRMRAVDEFIWGRLPFDSPDSRPYMYAKIADSLRQLGRDYHFDLDEPRCNHPVELVRVRQAADGSMLYRETK